MKHRGGASDPLNLLQVTVWYDPPGAGKPLRTIKNYK